MANIKFWFNLLPIFFIITGNSCNEKQNNNEEIAYKIEEPVYATLSEKSLDYFANFQYDSFAEMLAENVEYNLPNGKKIVGKINIVDYLKSDKVSTGLIGMRILNANYLPIHNYQKLKGDEMPGVKVVADFNNQMNFKSSIIDVKMNFNFHFNSEKLIDRIFTIYDQTLINNATEKDKKEFEG